MSRITCNNLMQYKTMDTPKRVNIFNSDIPTFKQGTKASKELVIFK